MSPRVLKEIVASYNLGSPSIVLKYNHPTSSVVVMCVAVISVGRIIENQYMHLNGQAERLDCQVRIDQFHGAIVHHQLHPGTNHAFLNIPLFIVEPGQQVKILVQAIGKYVATISVDARLYEV